MFLVSFAGHWTFAWFAFQQEQLAHGQAPQSSEFLVEVMRDTLENWQSEFLQLVWQVSGLTLLFHIGSPQSKDGNDRLEEKVDLILLAVDEEGKKKIKKLDDIYQRD
jgi:hypothetical protein